MSSGLIVGFAQGPMAWVAVLALCAVWLRSPSYSRQMRVVHLSTTDVGGGAARGSFALHEALLGSGVDSHMVVEQPTIGTKQVSGDRWNGARYMHGVRHRLDQMPVKAYRLRDPAIFTPAAVPSGVVSRVRTLNPDIVHLHWVGASFVRPEDVAQFGVPIVWTLRDLWPFTGGCHYSNGCRRYTESCGSCPALGSTRERDLSRWVWSRKSRAWKDTGITPVGIGQWIADRARESSLFGGRDIRVIENGIDTEFWQRVPEAEARDLFSIPADNFVVLFTALNLADERKGFRYFVDVCRQLAESAEQPWHALVLGLTDSGPDLGIPATYAGLLSDDAAIRSAYSAATVAVLPSTEDAFGKTAAEALACGTPCVVFADTGMADVVDDSESGFVASIGDVDSLVHGVKWLHAEPGRWRSVSEAGIASARRRFSVTRQAALYAQLYAELESEADRDNQNRT